MTTNPKTLPPQIGAFFSSPAKRGAYRRGYAAALDGQPESANPYSSHGCAITFHTEWRSGHYEARQQKRADASDVTT